MRVDARPNAAVHAAVGERRAPAILRAATAHIRRRAEAGVLVEQSCVERAGVTLRALYDEIAARAVHSARLAVHAYLEHAALYHHGVGGEIRTLEVDIAVDIAADYGELVAVAVDISVDIRVRDEGVALHHHIAVNADLGRGLGSGADPLVNVQPVYVEIFVGVDVVLYAAEGVLGLSAVEVLDARVFPEVTVAVDAELGKCPVQRRFLVIEEDILPEPVLESRLQRQPDESVVLQVVGQRVRIFVLGVDGALDGVVPVADIFAHGFVSVEQPHEHTGVGVKIAVERRAARRGGEHVQFHPVVVPAVFIFERA